MKTNILFFAFICIIVALSSCQKEDSTTLINDTDTASYVSNKMNINFYDIPPFRVECFEDNMPFGFGVTGMVGVPEMVGFGLNENYTGDYEILTEDIRWYLKNTNSFNASGNMPLVSTEPSIDISSLPNGDNYFLLGKIPFKYPSGRDGMYTVEFNRDLIITEDEFEYCNALHCPGCPGGTFLIVMTLTDVELGPI